MRQITDDWWIGLNHTYRTEEMDGDLVFLKPGRTVKAALYSADDTLTHAQHIDAWIAERQPPKSHELFRDDGDPARYACKHRSDLEDHTHIYTVHAVTISHGQMLDLTFIVDLQEHLDWATHVAQHVCFGTADDCYEDLDPSGPDGLTAEGTARIFGTEMHFPIRLAYREEPTDPDDSGWRFQHGSEDDAYLADYHNLRRKRLGEFMAMDNELRRIISQPIGTRWEREDDKSPWHIVK